MYRSVQREGEKYIKVALSYLVVELLSDHHLFCRANFLNLITHRKKFSLPIQVITQSEVEVQ